VADHKHRCPACSYGRLKEIARDDIQRRLQCDECEYSEYVEIVTVSRAASQKAYRERKVRGEVKPQKAPVMIPKGVKLIEWRPGAGRNFNPHPSQKFCPNCPTCNFHTIGSANCSLCHSALCGTKMVRVNLNEIFARKGCVVCKLKFDFIRSDTPEGIAYRQKQWRKKRASN
jgi:DNA-directed RNA polymerase subunit M/transcription elongation factor TFIIS